MIKKFFFAALCSLLVVSAWAQAPSIVGTDYVRPAIHYVEEGTNYVNSDVFFKLRSTDKETGLDFVEFALNGADFMRYKNPFQLLEEGKYDISYRGFDNSGNLELPKTLSVIVDNTAPDTMIKTTAPLYNDGVVVYCSADTKWYVSAADIVGGSGVAAGYMGTDLNSLKMSGNGKESEQTYVSLDGEGPVNLYYTAIDNVGNLAPIKLLAVTIDRTAPVVSIANSNRLINKDEEYMVFPSNNVVDEEGRVIVSTSETVSFAAKDDLSGVDAIYVKVNDGEYTKYVEPIRFTQNAVYKIEVKAIDNVGNVSDPVLYTFYVDQITPNSEVDIIDRTGNLLQATTPADER
ncbi:hypothetical protein E4N85_04990 [Treponema denticola]|uniref:OmpL47-type beta-barrel domain-containing protein n=1 Tax=Treponema denticola TaxID=158 RepID=UPI0020A32B43|nr:hypothetical protein [Treponema denticola]UTC95122.1 hypothetical protein E4N85_04990 [Treponema denticola]